MDEVRNSFVVARDGDRPFKKRDDGITVPQLNGYAVVPLEEYKQLLQAAGQNTVEIDPFLDRYKEEAGL